MVLYFQRLKTKHQMSSSRSGPEVWARGLGQGSGPGVWFNPILNSINLSCCRSYFSHPSTMVPTYGAGRDRREHRGEIFDYFLNLCVSVNSVRYNLFALPL